MWKSEKISDERLTSLQHAARMQEHGQTLRQPPTLSEISSIATELAELRRAPVHEDPEPTFRD